MEEPHLGFKTVTIENILETDPIVATLVTLNHKTGEVREQEYCDWVRIVNEIELDARVPREVRKAYTFSRGALCYAHWYYPALTLGMNDMLRIADFAAAQSCKERNINQPILMKNGKFRYFTFTQNLDTLAKDGIIPTGDVRMWRIIRDARNRATHPAAQNIFGFAYAYDTLKVVRDLINRIEWLPS
jgi:hypothetical protein